MPSMGCKQALLPRILILLVAIQVIFVKDSMFRCRMITTLLCPIQIQKENKLLVNAHRSQIHSFINGTYYNCIEYIHL